MGIGAGRRSVGLAGFQFFVARPLSVFIGLASTRTLLRLCAITGWFGVRAIGSVYYLMYAIEHGLPENLAREMASLMLTVIRLSVYLDLRRNQHQVTPCTFLKGVNLPRTIGTFMTPFAFIGTLTLCVGKPIGAAPLFARQGFLYQIRLLP